MIIRNLKPEERLNFNWKLYPFDISLKTTKENIISFVKSKLIKTNELAFEEFPVYINTIAIDIIIIDQEGQKQFAKYNHIYKGNIIKIEVNGKWINWSQARKNIRKIIFMDNLVYHNHVTDLWSERGFSFSKFYNNNIHDTLKDNIVKLA